MIAKIILATTLVFSLSCTSINESGRAYFRLAKPMAGVQTPEQVVAYVNRNPHMRRLLYGELKAAKILQCTILRNQLHVAMKKGTSGSEGAMIAEAALLMEKAYQEDDQAFLQACDQIMASKVGIAFWTIAQQYVTLN